MATSTQQQQELFKAIWATAEIDAVIMELESDKSDKSDLSDLSDSCGYSPSIDLQS